MGGRGRQKFAGIPTIRGKFIVLTLVLTVIPMVVLTFTFYRIAAHSIGEKSEALAMQSRQMSENYVNATLSDLNDLTNAILSNPDVQSMLETKPEDDYEYLRNDETLSMVVRTQTQTKPYITSSLIYAANGGLKHSLYQGNVSVRFGGLPTLEEARVYYRRLLAERPMMWMAHSPFESGRGMARDRIYVGKLLRKTTGDYAPLGFLLLEIDKASLFRGLLFMRQTAIPRCGCWIRRASLYTDCRSKALRIKRYCGRLLNRLWIGQCLRRTGEHGTVAKR